MTDLLINVDLSLDPSKGPAKKGSRKHQKFLQRRKYLEKRGFLKQKQLPNKLPNRKPGQPRNSWDHNKQNGQEDSRKGGHDRTGRINNNTFHKQGAPDASSRTVTVGAPYQPRNCAPSQPRPASTFRGHNSSGTDGAKQSANPLIQRYNLLSEYESGLPPVESTASHKMVAIDCEMVGTGPKGRNSALARCSIVNYQGDVVYDKYVKPICLVTDYRTRWSGIRREHLVNAIPFSVARKEVLKLLHGKIVVGHAIQNDYKALGYFHPQEMTRDTSKIPLLNQKAGIPEKETASLKRLTKQVLHKDIQMGKSGHSSVEDAKATMELYRAVEVEYEMSLKNGVPDASSQTVTVGAQCQPQNCAPNQPRPASPFKGHDSSATDGAKQSSKPLIQQPNQLSQSKSGLPSAVSVPSYKMVAIDCEMVGTGPKGRNSALARCSIVNYQGDVVYDKYVRPTCLVTDYRTRWSGIRREHLVNATPFSVAQKEVLKLLHGKIVIGHAIENDYKALGYFHPKEMTRDTSKIPLLNHKAGIPEKEMASLKRLTKLVLNKDIQVGKSGHSSVEDAKATMELYRAVEAEYERELVAGTVQK